MIKNEVCPKCNCREIGQGKQVGNARMIPVDNLSWGSNVIADICTECGYIIEMRVEKPRKFK
ncbi:MAG: hypothetical protein ACRDA3_16205 [Peptostreptococcaceae bacterium]